MKHKSVNQKLKKEKLLFTSHYKNGVSDFIGTQA